MCRSYISFSFWSGTWPVSTFVTAWIWDECPVYWMWSSGLLYHQGRVVIFIFDVTTRHLLCCSIWLLSEFSLCVRVEPFMKLAEMRFRDNCFFIIDVEKHLELASNLYTHDCWMGTVTCCRLFLHSEGIFASRLRRNPTDSIHFVRQGKLWCKIVAQELRSTSSFIISTVPYLRTVLYDYR